MFETRGRDVVITLRDCGWPFDPAQVVEPDMHRPLAERRIGGLGMHLMYQLMDDVHFAFSEAGNTLVMVKRSAVHDDVLGAPTGGAMTDAGALDCPGLRARRGRRKAPELATLAEIGRAILQAELDQEALCELIHRLAGRIVPTDTFQLGLFDGESYQIKVWVKEGQRQPPATFTVPEGQGIIGACCLSEQAEHVPLLGRLRSDQESRWKLHIPPPSSIGRWLAGARPG